MKTIDVPAAIDGIIFDANAKLGNGASHATVIFFMNDRLNSLKRQLIRQKIYRARARGDEDFS